MKKVISIVMVLVMMLLIGMTNSYAGAVSFKMKLAPDKAKVAAGETVTIAMVIDEITAQAQGDGISGYQAILQYDTKVFENMAVTSTEEWDSLGQMNEGRLATTRKDGLAVTKKQEVALIKLTVKADAELGSSEVKLKEVKGSNNGVTVPTADATTTIEIGAKAEEKPEENTNTNTNTNGGTNTNTNTNTKTNTTKADPKGTSKTALPKAGSVEFVIPVAIVTLVVISIVAFIKYKRAYRE